jgi:hypothetical protein
MQEFIEWLYTLDSDDLKRQLEEWMGAGVLAPQYKNGQPVRFTGKDCIVEKLTVFAKKPNWKKEIDDYFRPHKAEEVAAVKKTVFENAKKITKIIKEELKDSVSHGRWCTKEGALEEAKQKIEAEFTKEKRHATRKIAKIRTQAERHEIAQPRADKEIAKQTAVIEALPAGKEAKLSKTEKQFTDAKANTQARIAFCEKSIRQLNEFLFQLKLPVVTKNKSELDLAKTAAKSVTAQHDARSLRHQRRMSQPNKTEIKALFNEIEKKKELEQKKLEEQKKQEEKRKLEEKKKISSKPSRKVEADTDDPFRGEDGHDLYAENAYYGFTGLDDAGFTDLSGLDDLEVADWDALGDDLVFPSSQPKKQTKVQAAEKPKPFSTPTQEKAKKRKQDKSASTPKRTLPVSSTPHDKLDLSAVDLSELHAGLNEESDVESDVEDDLDDSNQVKAKLREDIDESKEAKSKPQAKPQPLPRQEAHPVAPRPSSQPNNAFMQAQRELKAAENKVANGIAGIYTHCLKEKLEFDRQGIATIELSPAKIRELKLSQYFPMGMTSGVAVHIYHEKAISHPPVKYMGLQKIKSLCDAAVAMGMSTADVEKIRSQLTESFEKRYTQLPLEIDEFHEKSEKLLEETANRALKSLYAKARLKMKERLEDADEETPISYEGFAEKLRKKTLYRRSSQQDILTFDQKNNRFSFDEIPSFSKSSHYPYSPDGPGNLGIVYEGDWVDAKTSGIKANVTSRLMHHAALSPVYNLGIVGDSFNISPLVRTCQRIYEIMGTMVCLRMHGRSESEKSLPIDINWVYQFISNHLLTDINKEKAHALIAEAMNLMNGLKFEMQVDGSHVAVPITFHMNVFSASLGKSSEEPGLLTALQDQENVKAYIELTNALFHAIPDRQKEDEGAENFNELKKLLSASNDELDACMRSYEDSRSEKQRRSGEFYQQLQIYLENDDVNDKAKTDKRSAAHVQISRCRALASALDNSSRQTAMRIREARARLYAQNASKVQTLRNKVKQDLRKLCGGMGLPPADNAEQMSKMLAQFRSGAELTEEKKQRLLSAVALIYKCDMDALYYSRQEVMADYSLEQYRSSEHVLQFHVYMAAYQRLIGMMASAGGKCGNNTTYLLRIALAAMEGRPLLALPAPLGWHDEGAEDNHGIFSALIDDAKKANSALFNTIVDTSGGTPKVDHRYVGFENQKDMSFLEEFSAYASHLFEFAPEVKALAGKIVAWGAGGFVIGAAATLIVAFAVVGAPAVAALFLGFVAVAAAPWVAAAVIGVIGFAVCAIGAKIGFSASTRPVAESKKLMFDSPKEKPSLGTTASVTSTLTSTAAETPKQVKKTLQKADYELETVVPSPVVAPRAEAVAAPAPAVVASDDKASESSSNTRATATDSPRSEVELDEVGAPDDAAEEDAAEIFTTAPTMIAAS